MNPTSTLKQSLLLSALLLATAPALAWGPHPDITRAAMAPLADDDPICRALGPCYRDLPDWCWMPDWRRSLIVRAAGAFHPDDFLLFPASPTHIGHMAPDVHQTWAPYFRRALQALRTETPPNAARWTGTLLHYIEDTAAPPHAAPTGGKLHGPMENWIDGKLVSIRGHVPKSFGTDDDAALKEFLRRMEEMEAYARERGLKIRPLAAAENRAAVEPLALENADAAARVAADTLHTLGALAPIVPAGGAALHGVVATPAPAVLTNLPAKIMLAGTSYSTLADAAGAYAFRNLPPARYRVLCLRPGAQLLGQEVELAAGTNAVCDLAPAPSVPPGNLLRNPDFKLRWVSPSAPDDWYKQKDAWEGEAIPVVPGQRLRLSAEWQDGAKGAVSLRWHNTPAPSGGQLVAGPTLKPGTADCVAVVPEKMTYVRVSLETKADPASALRRVALVLTSDKD